MIEELKVYAENLKEVYALEQEQGQYQYLIDIEEVKQMKQGSIIVNTSRGSLINEDALVYALNNKILSGIGLDVFPEEPYYGKLINYDNVILTPHIATLTAESRLNMEIRAVENLVEFFKK